MSDQNIDFKQMKQAAMFVSSFFALFKAENLYPRGHKMLDLAMERFYAQLKSTIAQEQKISLRIFDNNLYYQKLPLDTGKIPDITNFLEKLHERYIRRIVFNTGTNITDINALITLLKTPPETISPEGGPKKILEQNGAKNITLVEYYNKSRSSINQKQLSSLTDSSVFEFLTDDSKSSLSSEQAYSIYELLKDTPLICALIKTASQNQYLKERSNLSENANILEIVKKIKAVIDEHNISEKTEVKSILHDILSSNSQKDFFDLVFEHPDDEIINYTNVSASMFDKLGPQKTAEFMTQKITNSKGDSKVISQAKSVLEQLKDSNGMQTFIPAFKDTIKKSIPSESKAKRIINDICSSIDPECSLEIDAELSLGHICGNDNADILKGLNILNNVYLKKEVMVKRISSFDQVLGYISLLEELIGREKETKIFTKIVDKLVLQTKIQLEKNKTEIVLKIFDFLHNLVSDPKGMDTERKKKVFKSLGALPLAVLEELITKTLYLTKEQDINAAFKQLLYLFPSNFMTLLINRFISSEATQKRKLLLEIISKNYKSGALKLDIDLKKAPVSQITQLMDLLQNLNSDEILPFLWEITFRENINIAKKSLKIIASKKSDKALTFLIKAVDSSNIPLRIAGIECLGYHNTPKTRTMLVEISQGKINMTDSILENVDIRIAALHSLELLDSAEAIKIFRNIMGKKRLLFINAEHKKLRAFAALKLKKIS